LRRNLELFTKQFSIQLKRLVSRLILPLRMSPRHRSVQIDAFKKLIDTPELPDLGPGPRSQVEPLASLRQKLDQLFSDTDLAEATAQFASGRCVTLA
jgi:hypothetical protein